MLFDNVAPDDITSPIKRKFVGSGFQNFLLGVSGTDEYGNTTGWGKAKGVVLPALYGTLGAVGTTLAGLGPGVGAKFGSQLGSGLNSITGSFGSSLLEGTDGKDSYGQQQTKSAMQAQTTAGVIGTLGGFLGGNLLSGQSGGGSAMGAAPVASLLGGGSGTGANANLGLDAPTDSLEAFKLGLNQNNFGQLAFKGGGEVKKRSIPAPSVPASSTSVVRPVSPLQIQQNALNSLQERVAENRATISASTDKSPAVQQYWEDQANTQRRKDIAIKAADVMAMGSMIPTPITQAVGAAGAIGGSLIRGQQVAKDIKTGDYTNAALGAAGIGMDMIGLGRTPFGKAIPVTAIASANKGFDAAGSIKSYANQTVENLQNFGRTPVYNTPLYSVREGKAEFNAVSRGIPNTNISSVFSGKPLHVASTAEDAIQNSIDLVGKEKKFERLNKLWADKKSMLAPQMIQEKKSFFDAPRIPNVFETYRGVKTDISSPRTIIGALKEGAPLLRGEQEVAKYAITNAPKNPTGGTYQGVGIYSASAKDVAKGYATERGYLGTLKNPATDINDFFKKGVNSNGTIKLTAQEAEKLNKHYGSSKIKYSEGMEVPVFDSAVDKDFVIADILKNRGKMYKITDYGEGNFHTIYLPGIKPELVDFGKAGKLEGVRNFTRGKVNTSIPNSFRFPIDFDNPAQVASALDTKVKKSKMLIEDNLIRYPNGLRQMKKQLNSDVNENMYKYNVLVGYEGARQVSVLPHLKRYAPLYAGGAAAGAIGAGVASQLKYKGGGEVPTWVKTLRLVGESGPTAYQGKVYDLSSLPMEPSSTKVARPQVVGETILSRIASAEGSRYDQKNNVGPGHYGKYQFEPALIQKYAGVTPEEFLKNPDIQELAMQRRLPDLKKEAESALKTTRQSLPLEDAMLLVHFKGLPTAMKELQNPALMNVSTKVNPSSKEYLRRASVFTNPAKGSIMERIGSSFLGPSETMQRPSGINADFMNPKKGSPIYTLGETFFRTGGEVGKGKIYADDDNTEDYYMVDKGVAASVGLSDVINQISFGQARYGERIFSQKSNEEMKKIMSLSKTKAQKAKMLGSHVFSELSLQAKNEPKQRQMFATGDEVNDPKTLFEQQKDAYLARLNEAIANLDTFEERQKKPGRPTDIDTNRYREFLLRKKEELQLLEYGEVKTQNNTGIGGRTEVNVIGPEDLKTLFDQTEPVVTGQFIRNPTLTRQYNQKGADMISLGGDRFRKYDPAPLKPITWDEFLGKASTASSKSSPAASASTTEIKVPTLPPITAASSTTGAGGVTPAGATTSSNQTTGFAFDPSITEEVINAQRRMNQRGSRLLPNFVPIAQDGKWGQSTEILDRQLKARMGPIYNITNQRVVLPTEQGPRLMVTDVDINDPTKQAPITTFAPMGISRQVGVMSPNQLGQTASTRMAQSIKQTGITKENRPTEVNTTNRLGEIASYLPDVGRLIVGATTAAANQPKPFDLGSEYFKMKSDLENRSNQGLPSAQRNFLTNQLRDNYASGAETLRSAVGNGASIGTLVAGLGRLGTQYQQGVVGIAGIDEAQRTQNRQTYQNFVLQDLNLRSGLFGREEAIRAANRQGAGMLIGAAMDNIQGRTDFNRQYGPGSQYAQMQGYISGLYKKALENQDAQATAYMNSLKNT